ncbi:Hypothetical_protein [Hexamita inflata]|uniref:Hypothetical_protein n=1 Tax=Hexamita inflata TaxID=28002 RepID=A0AA86NW09_9EUKA|nr:Hypothetical protein HINF_LOCUS14316 [Hexamita inflata]
MHQFQVFHSNLNHQHSDIIEQNIQYSRRPQSAVQTQQIVEVQTVLISRRQKPQPPIYQSKSNTTPPPITSSPFEPQLVEPQLPGPQPEPTQQQIYYQPYCQPFINEQMNEPEYLNPIEYFPPQNGKWKPKQKKTLCKQCRTLLHLKQMEKLYQKHREEESSYSYSYREYSYESESEPNHDEQIKLKEQRKLNKEETNEEETQNKDKEQKETIQNKEMGANEQKKPGVRPAIRPMPGKIAK